MPATRPRRIVRRIMLALAVVVLLPVLMVSSYVATWLLIIRDAVNATGPHPRGTQVHVTIEGFGPIEEYIAAGFPGADVLSRWQREALKGDRARTEPLRPRSSD